MGNTSSQYFLRRGRQMVRVDGTRIREARDRLGAFQREIAAQAGLKRHKISDLERGHSTFVGVEDLEALAVALRCEAGDLAPEILSYRGQISKPRGIFGWLFRRRSIGRKDRPVSRAARIETESLSPRTRRDA